jgi:ATP-dependent RNA helicase SUPV3L1/SUV3
VLAGELAQRADALAGAPDEAIALTPNGRFIWAGAEIARLEKGETALKPRIQLLVDEHLAASDRERLLKRLEARLKAELEGKLKPLILLSEASDLSGLARGLGFQLTENLGVLRRETASNEIKALDQSARAQLRKYGVRFGAFNVYIPALLKPAAADLSLLLWSLASGREHGLDIDALPPRPKQGLTSVEAARHIPEAYWRAAGFHVAGTRAVRIDMLERLSDLIRARIAYRAEEAGAGPAPSGATGDGGFRVVPELMSVVGCSGEEFASILKALGFRRERRPIAPGPTPTSEGPKVAPQSQETASQDAQPEAFDEIWRPGKRKEAQHDKRGRHHAKRAERAKSAKRDRQRAQPQRAKRERRERVEHSPFAALAALKGRLSARPEGS